LHANDLIIIVIRGKENGGVQTTIHLFRPENIFSPPTFRHRREAGMTDEADIVYSFLKRA